MRPSASSAKQIALLYDQIFFCPSCTTWRTPQRLTLLGPRPSRCSRRNATTWNSSTAVNATKPIPPRLRPLYDSLVDVRKYASSHINTSRLQLALQGLESTHPIIRLAILGLDVPDTARKIARLLLADPLEDYGQWENQLTQGDVDYSRGLIIRFGRRPSSSLQQPRNSVPVLYVPAEVLQRHNIELLVSSVNGPSIDPNLKLAATPPDTFLSPAVGTPTSSDGRQTIISQPVHKTLLVAQGLGQLLAISRLLASTNFTTEEDRASIRVAIDLRDNKSTENNGDISVIDKKAADEGLAAIRKSVTLATEYEHKWMASGMTGLSNWMLLGTTNTESQTKGLLDPVESLIRSVLKTTSSNVELARSSSYLSAAEHSLSSAEKYTLESAVDQFSRSAHQELQSGLASAWSSRNWRKLAWFKLFWRVDDVGLIITDLVNNAWLPKTERAVYELSGRLIQLGINPVMVADSTSQVIPTEAQSKGANDLQKSILQPPPEISPQLATTATTAFTPTAHEAAPPIAVITNPYGAGVQIDVTPIAKPQPLAKLISTMRRSYIITSTTNLSSTAQQLVLRTLSLTGLTGGLTMLTYFSSLSGSLYEAGTIFAVGSVYALWTMQKGWMKATKRFEEGLFQQGRDVILDVTAHMRRLLQLKGEIELDPVETSSLQRAEEAVKRANLELQRLTTNHKSQVTNPKS